MTITHVELHGTNFGNADIRGASLQDAMSHGLTAFQVFATKSYQERDLSGTQFSADSLTAWDFGDFNLSETYFTGCNLFYSDFSGADLSHAYLYGADVRGASFVNADLSFANFQVENLGSANITGAIIRGADLSYTKITSSGFTLAQIYSTKSYQNKDLSDVDFAGNAMGGIDLSGQNLTGVSFDSAGLPNANLTDAIIDGVDLTETTLRGLKREQIYSTRNYNLKNLSGIIFDENHFAGWDFSGQNLTNISFYDSSYSSNNFEAADLRGALHLELGRLWTSSTNNMIKPDGSIDGLDLSSDDALVIRDHDGNPDAVPARIDPIAVSIHEQFQMADNSVLELFFEADEWNSTISFEAGIPVALDGKLELTFAEDVNIADQIGRTIDLFDWTGVTPTGQFNVSSVYEWDLANLYTTGEVTLASVAALPGDFDGDGDVDGRDLLALQRDPNLGSFTTWQANYGGSINGLATFVPVPEPSSAVVLLSAMMGMLSGVIRSGGASRRD